MTNIRDILARNIVNLYCIPVFTSACHCFSGLENSLFLVIIIPSVYPDVVKDDGPSVPTETVQLLQAGEHPIPAATRRSDKKNLLAGKSRFFVQQLWLL